MKHCEIHCLVFFCVNISLQVSPCWPVILDITVVGVSPALTEAVLRYDLWHTSQDWEERGLTVSFACLLSDALVGR